MRKNQFKNRGNRKKQYRRIESAAKINRQLNHKRRTVRKCIGPSVIFGLLLVILFLTALFSCRSDLWTTSEITYQRHYQMITSGRTSTSYYVLVDDEGLEWQIHWDVELKQTTFFSDVKEGDRLTVSWHYWWFGRSVKSLESGGHIYRSMAEAEEAGRNGLTLSIVFMAILAVALAIPLGLLFRTLFEMKRLKKWLALQQRMDALED